MTHLILQADIELTQKLIAGRQPDNEIVAALVRRGIDQEKASRLLQNLQQGVPVAPEIEINYEEGFKRSPEPGQPEGASKPKTRASSRSQRRKQEESKGKWIWILLILAVVVGGAIYYGMTRAGKRPESAPLPEATSEQEAPAKTGSTSAPPVTPAP